MCLLPCDVDLKVRGGERRWSVTLSFVRVPRRRPRHRAHQFRSPARGFEGIAARPIRRVGEELVRSDLPLREPVNDRHAHVGVAPTRGGHLHVGDELGGVLLVAGLRHLHLVPPSPCGRCRSHPGRGAIAASRRTPASGPSRPRAPCIPQHRRHRPWGARPGVCPHGTAPAAAAPAAGTPPAGQQSCHGTGPPAGRGPGHRPKGVADPPPCGRPRSGSPRLLPSNSALGGPPEPQGEALGAPSARPAGNNRIVSQNRPSRVSVAMLLMMWVESSRCFPVRMPSAWMIRSVVSWKASRPPSCCIRRTRKLWRVFWGRWVSSMSSRRAWCQSRLNSSCSRASSSVRLNISLRRWTPRTVCTARLGRPLPTQYMGAKRSSSIRGSASFRKTSAQLLSRRLAFFGVTRNWDCQRLSCGSRIRNILPSLGQAQRPRPFITLSPPCPQAGEGFLPTNQFMTFCTKTMEEAFKIARPGINSTYSQISGPVAGLRPGLLGKNESLSSEDAACDWFDFLWGHDVIMVGTPDHIAERIDRLQRELNFQHFQVFPSIPNITFKQYMESLDLLGLNWSHGSKTRMIPRRECQTGSGRLREGERTCDLMARYSGIPGCLRLGISRWRRIESTPN